MAGLEFEAKISAGELNKLLRDLANGSQEAAKAINDAFGGTVTKKLVLETVTDEKGVRSLVAVEKERLSVTDKIIKEKEKLERIDRDSVTSLRQQVNKAKQARDEISKYAERIDSTGQSVRGLNDAWVTQNAKVQDLQRKLAAVDGSPFWDRLKGDLGVRGLLSFGNGLTQITQGFQSASIIVGQFIASINQLVDALANLQNFNLSFEAIGAGGLGATQALSESSRIALNLGTDLKTVRTGFQQLTPVVQNSGGTISDVSRIIEALSSRFAVFGLSGDKARRVTNGIIQAFAKGKLQAEEFTQQIAEADPAFGTDFARALGVTTQKLQAQIKAGKITNDVLIKYLPQLSKASLLYGKLGTSATDAVSALASGNVTFDQVRNKINSLNQLSLESLAGAVKPVLGSFFGLQAVVTDFFSALSSSSAVRAFGEFLGGITNAATGLLSVFVGVANGAVTALNAVAPFVEIILKIPGISEAIGIAILSKLVAPLGSVVQGFKAAATGSGAFGQIASKVIAPFNDIRQAITRSNTSIQSSSSISEQVSKSYARQANSLAALSAQSSFASLQTKKYGDELSSLRQKLSALESRRATGAISGGGVLSGQVNLVKNQIKETEKLYDRYSQIQQRAASKFQDQSAIFGSGLIQVGAQGKNLGELSDRFERTSRSVASLTNVNANATRSISALNSRLSSLKDETTALNRSFLDGRISTSAYAESKARLAKETANTVKRLGQFEKIQASTSERINQSRARLDALQSIMARTGASGQAAGGIIGGAFSRIGGIFGSVKNAAVGLGAALGPIGAILLGLSVVTSAYATSQGRTNEILGNSKKRIQELQEATERLNGKTAESDRPIKGLNLAWRQFSSVTGEAVRGIADFYNSLSSGTDNAGKSISIFERLAGALAAIGAGALAGAAIGAAFGGIGAGPGAVVGSLVAALALLAGTGSDAAVKTLELKKNLEATTKSIQDETKETIALVRATERRLALNAKLTAEKKAGKGQGPTDANVLAGESGYRQALNSLRQLESQQDQTRQTSTGLKEELDALSKTGKNIPLQAQLRTLKKDILDLKVQAPLGSLIQLPKTLQKIDQLNRKRAEIERQLAGSKPVSNETLNKYNELKTKLKIANAELAKQNPAVAQARAAVDSIARKYGFLTAEQEKNAKTQTKQAALVKELRTAFENTDPAKQGKLWTEYGTRLAQASVELDRIKDNLTAFENIQIAKEIKIRVSKGEIANSLANANREIKSLEEAIILLDIDSPELPNLLQRLREAKVRAEELEGKKARIEIEILQRGIGSGSIPESLNNVNELIKSLEGQVARLDINSPELPVVIADLQQAKAQLDSINGTVATITVRVIQQGLESGALAPTQELLRRQAALQKQVVETTPTTSTNYDKEIEKLKKFEAASKAAAMSTQELKDKLAQNNRDNQNEGSQIQLDRLKTQREAVIARYEQEKQKIRETAEIAKEASDERIRQLRQQLDVVNSIADQQIAALEAPTYAEQQLKQLRKQDLQAQASKGGREGLEAQAQLDDIARQEKIAEIKKRAAEEEKRIQAEIKKEEEAQRKRDEEAKKKEREIEKKIQEEQKAIRDAELQHATRMQAEREREYEQKKKAREEENNAIKEELQRRGELTKAQADTNAAVSQGTQDIKTNLVPSLEVAAELSAKIAKTFRDLNGTTITINIKENRLGPGRWAGGPVTSGMTYTVNELGKEGFLSASGRLSMINKPQNGTWRAPSSGTVIPANIMDRLDIPKAGVKVNNVNTRPPSNNQQMKTLLRSMFSAINGSNSSNSSAVRELSTVQAGQAAQIGKLSRAVDRLVSKDWNVNVHVRPNATLSYVDALNHRL